MIVSFSGSSGSLSYSKSGGFRRFQGSYKAFGHAARSSPLCGQCEVCPHFTAVTSPSSRETESEINRNVLTDVLAVFWQDGNVLTVLRKVGSVLAILWEDKKCSNEG